MVQLDPAHLDPARTWKRGPRHREANLGRRRPGVAVGRLARRNDDKAIEPQLAHRRARDRDVAGVRRVEPPAEDADPRSARHLRGR
jgi:hypothetical protein